MRSLVGSLVNRSPVPYSSNRGGYFSGSRASSSSVQALSAMGSVGTLFAIVSRISQDVAAATWCLYRKNAFDAHSGERQMVTKHPALTVWNRPNPHMNRQSFLEITSQHQELAGEQFWVPAENDTFNFPVELWPIRPDRMREVPDAEKFLAGWVYSSPDGQRVPLDVENVIQLKSPNPMNIFRGMGAVQSILTDLDSSLQAAEWNRNFFINGAQPGGLIEVPNSLQDDEFLDFQQRWREGHQGVSAAHRVAMLENGMKWVDVNYSQKDMQFAELRNVSREIIREAFGMSKTMLGQTEDVNRASADAAKAVYGEHVLVPRLDRIKSAANEIFLPMFGAMGEDVEFDYVSPIPADRDREASERTSKAAAITAMVNLGFDPMEVLALYGLPPLKFVGKDNGQNTTVA